MGDLEGDWELEGVPHGIGGDVEDGLVTADGTLEGFQYSLCFGRHVLDLMGFG
jgi:hypothetical protein